MVTITVKFDRIGRHRNVPDLVAACTEATSTAVELAVWQYARAFLLSLEYDVDVDMETRAGDIDGGRFGTFTFEVLEPEA